MRLWNLNESPVPGTLVLQPYDVVTSRIQRRMQPRHLPSRFKIALSIAALTTSFSMGAIQANASSVRLPLSAVSVAQSIPEPSPPLAEFFQGSFNAEWTEELENQLLMRVESNRLQGSSSPLIEQTINVVFSNQLENLSDATSKRMTRDQIAALVMPRKLDR
jgi:hypothetical protein